SYRIATLRKEQIRDELVVAFQVEIADIEKNHRIERLGALSQHLDGTLMSFEQWTEMPCNERKFYYVGHGTLRELRDQARHQPRFRRCFDHQCHLGRRFGQGHRRFRGWELSAVDHIAPVDQLRERLSVKSELAAGHICEQLRAGLVVGIVKLPSRTVGTEMSGVGRCQKSALMMVKPPGNPS